MKITFVLPGIFIAGGVRAVLECSDHLVARGHSVNIVYPMAPLQARSSFSLIRLFRHTVLFFINIFTRNRVRWFDLKAKLIRVPFLHPQVIKIFENAIPDADVVIATTWDSAISVNLLSSKKGRKAYFVQHYEVMDILENESCWEQAKECADRSDNAFISIASIVPKDMRLNKYKEKVDSTYLLPLAKFTTSSALAELIMKRFKQKVYGNVPIGTNFKMFSPEGEKAEDKVILMPFMGIGWKGGLDGLAAIKKVREKIKDVKVIMFGLDKYRRYLPNWVDFRGVVSDAALLRRLYSYADVFVSPTWIEGWSMPQMEAMACGTACVTTNVGAVPEYAVNNKTAVIVPPRDPEAMAAAISELLENTDKRKEIAAAGYRSIQSYTWENAAKEMEKILLEIINE